ncbi:MAG: hypothetical protein BWY69_00277 [Planctomycetes bacterium ADurb.Bin401]|nr:MAG: hypothetical protein BWY69_00277 [Planctomycetes bacterium ADurb.Bin401]
MKRLIYCCQALVLLFVFSNAFGASSWLGQRILPDDGAAGDFFGSSVSISGQFAAVGAEQDDSAKGCVYIFKRVAGHWVQTQKLTASDGGANNYFGRCVCISGNLAIVGVYGDDDKGSNSGSAIVYGFNGTSWIISDNQFRIYQCRLDFDLTGDCLVDFEDFAELTSEWLMCGDLANPECQP